MKTKVKVEGFSVTLPSIEVSDGDGLVLRLPGVTIRTMTPEEAALYPIPRPVSKPAPRPLPPKKDKR